MSAGELNNKLPAVDVQEGRLMSVSITPSIQSRQPDGREGTLGEVATALGPLVFGRFDPVVTFVTTNSAKIQEARRVLHPSGFQVVAAKIALREHQTMSLEEVSLFKALEAHDRLNTPVLVDDTGIFFDSYDHFPGVLTRLVFAGLGLDGVMRLVDEGTGAHFRTVVTYADERTTIQGHGVLRGRLTRRIAATVDSARPFMSIFIPDGTTKTLAEMRAGEIVNHREQAIRQLVKAMEGR